MNVISERNISRVSRHFSAVLLAGIMVLLPFGPCFADCCCDAKGPALESISEASSDAPCHSAETAIAAECRSNDPERDSFGRGSDCLDVSSICPCPELQPPAQVADNKGPTESLLRPLSMTVSKAVVQFGNSGPQNYPLGLLYASPLFNGDRHLALCVFRI